MGFALTTEQDAAVNNRGGGLLVSAAAGSGKTRVLVERMLTRVTREGCNVDEFLIITYTRAAAAELRARIAHGLSERLGSDPGDAHLRRQAALVYKAQISTVHAFCAALLREFGHLADISPDFRLCDEGEMGVLMRQAVNDVMDSRYETIAAGSDFALLVDTMSAGRDDSRLVEIVIDIFSRIQSHPDPDRWLGEQETAFRLDGITDAGQTPWGKLLLEDARRLALYWQGRLRSALELASRDPKLARAYAPSLSETLDSLASFSAAAERGWDEAAAHARIAFPRLGAVRGGCDDPDAQERIKAIRDKCKKRMEKNADSFLDRSASLLQDIRTVHPAVRGLFALVRDFTAAYAAEKSRRGLMDFFDLEHAALGLLREADGTPAALARQLSTRYTEVMVDEFQDTNEVQNAIFDAISGSGRKLFLVGDVKQSIYRFRLADPTIFLGKYLTFRSYTEAVEGENRRVTLSRNFRSRPEVLESVNYLFQNIMSVEFGEMDYTGEEALYPGAAFPERDGCRTELDVLDCGALEAGGSGRTDKNLIEARFVARRIRRMLDEGQLVSDEAGGMRPARPEDMVILLRSPGTVLSAYMQALTEQGLPWDAEGADDFFGTTEVSVALSLLQIVDNPRQDVPLISALRSPVYGFPADRLAEVRAGCGGDFYDALAHAAERGGADCRAFLEELGALRFGAGDRSSHQLIWHIYERTNLLGIFGVMPGGQERQNNLLTLYELARRFEGAGHRGLFGFLSHLSRLRDAGARVAGSGGGKAGGGVSILSIHRSKGLEFPVVFLCGLAKRFNREDMQKPMLFHPKLGVGPKGLDLERMVEYTTLPRLAVAKQLEREMMAEELRLLYVAMTRAKEKLIMTHTLATGAGELKNLREDTGCPVEPQALASCSCVGQWVLLAAMARPESEALWEAAELRTERTEGVFGRPWEIRLIDGSSCEAAPERPEQPAGAPARQASDDVPAERLAWKNPYAALADVPSKITATQLKGRFIDEESAQETQASARPLPCPFDRPRFAAGEFGLTAAQRGIAVHQVLQYMDFSRTETDAELQAEIRRLVDLALITPQQGEAVDLAQLMAFFSSELGRQIKSASSLRREFKFSLLVPAADYYPGVAADEKVLLQGVIDCWFEQEDGLTVLDFKTDRVSEKTVPARAEEYRPQLTAYSRALAKITGKPVKRRVLWFLALKNAVEL